MSVKIESNAAELSKAIQAYVRTAGKSLEEALRKQGSKLGFNLRKELFGIAPTKGSIREAALARLKAGGGIKVRPSVLKKIYQKYGARSVIATGTTVLGKKGKGTVRSKGKQLNIWQLAVQSEINLRESAIGFLGVSASYRGLSSMLDTAEARSKYGPRISVAGFHGDQKGGSITFNWGGLGLLSTEAAEGLTKQKGEDAVNRALVGTTEDIEEYLTRKLGENWANG